MRSSISSLVVVLIFSSGTIAQPSPKKGAQDIWESVFARDKEGRDQQIGYAHLRLEPVTVDGKTVVRGTRELRIQIKRDGQLAQLKADSGTEEAEDGKVVGIFMQHWIGEKQALVMNGRVHPSGKSISLVVQTNLKNEFENTWDPKVIGLSRELTLLRDKKVAPGDAFSYRMFEPSISSVVTIQAKVKDAEEVLLPRGGKKNLLRVDTVPEKLSVKTAEGEIQEVQLPGTTVWADPKTYEQALMQTEIPGFGLLTLQRSTKAVATGPLGDVPDLMKLQTIRLNKMIDEQKFGSVHGLHGIVFRITVQGKDVDLAKLIKEDDRQTIKELKDNSCELHILARRSPRKLDKEKPPGEEFLKSNYFINSDDENVKELAKKAVGERTDPWDKAKAIESWVRANMKPVNYSEAMATADHVATTLSGDCSEYSMLAAAMCRAQGIPSRTALGLVYVYDEKAFGGPALAFHMWTEVYIKGQWLGLDATLGRGSIGPAHIKVTDHSWHETRDFKPLLPVTGFIMAKPTIEIKSATLEAK